MRILIFDSGPLINLSMNGLLFILEELKKDFDGKFIITEPVRREVVDKPMNVQKFELGAVRIQNLINKGVLEFPNVINVNPDKIMAETEKLSVAANHSMRLRSQAITLVSEAEMSCVALANELKKQEVEVLVAVDERTTRILSEAPTELEKIMSSKLHHDIKIDVRNLNDFKNIRFIRSSELVYVAYKKGLIGLQGSKVLEALVYATKFKGSAISFEELNELKKL
jgi:hypothetical protein